MTLVRSIAFPRLDFGCFVWIHLVPCLIFFGKFIFFLRFPLCLCLGGSSCVLASAFVLLSVVMVLVLECRMFYSGSYYCIVSDLLASCLEVAVIYDNNLNILGKTSFS